LAVVHALPAKAPSVVVQTTGFDGGRGLPGADVSRTDSVNVSLFDPPPAGLALNRNVAAWMHVPTLDRSKECSSVTSSPSSSNSRRPDAAAQQLSRPADGLAGSGVVSHESSVPANVSSEVPQDAPNVELINPGSLVETGS